MQVLKYFPFRYHHVTNDDIMIAEIFAGKMLTVGELRENAESANEIVKMAISEAMHV